MLKMLKGVIMKRKNYICYMLLFSLSAVCVLGASASSSYALDNEVTATNNDKRGNLKSSSSFDVNKIPSLLFTYWQHKSIKDAEKNRGAVRPPTQAELDALERGDEVKKDPGPREVALGGIVFTAKDDWVIWLNGKRVMPDAIPKEVMDLHVFKDYIELKWIDEYTNQIFPIRLRTHQRFNMDNKIFLPG